LVRTERGSLGLVLRALSLQGICFGSLLLCFCVDLGCLGFTGRLGCLAPENACGNGQANGQRCNGQREKSLSA
jgi:hypothetical protein